MSTPRIHCTNKHSRYRVVYILIINPFGCIYLYYLIGTSDGWSNNYCIFKLSVCFLEDQKHYTDRFSTRNDTVYVIGFCRNHYGKPNVKVLLNCLKLVKKKHMSPSKVVLKKNDTILALFCENRINFPNYTFCFSQ